MTKLQKILEELKSPKKHVNAHTIEEYFAFPKEEREQWGFWYKTPIALPCLFEEVSEDGWDEFYRRIRKEYPIQGWVREWLLSLDNPVYAFIFFTKRRLVDFWYKRIVCLFNPRHKTLRKALPRTWMDTCSLIVDLNFAMIVEFYHDEVVDGHVEWNSDSRHKKFYNWLVSAVKYIETEKKDLEKLLDDSYPSKEQRRLPYEEAYKEVNRLEKQIKDSDSKILKEMITFRDFFWT